MGQFTVTADLMTEQIDKVMEIHDGGKGLPQMQKCPGRQGLPLKEWAAGQIEATPHGVAAIFFIKSMRVLHLSKKKKETQRISPKRSGLA